MVYPVSATAGRLTTPGKALTTLNGASIYIFAKRNPEKIRDDKDLALLHSGRAQRSMAKPFARRRAARG